MATSFLSYLRLPNPAADSSECKGGGSSLGSHRYKPDEVKPWEDLTLENLEKTYKDVLLNMMDKPKILNAGEISPERLDLYEEESVKTLAEQWNEKVVQHVLRGTQELLHRKLPEGPFGDGQIYFRKNHGQGHITSQNGRPQKPDWCVYQKKDGWGTKPCPNLLPGDIKPAKKWKSEWITSSDSTMRRKADLVLNQITKYMYLGGKRYGFILSEEELVAVRLSMFTRDTEALQELAQDDSAAAAHMIGSFQNLDDKSDEDFADAQRRQGRYLEYCGIPWDASGEDSFTVNLTLWWLTVLAMQDASIKSVGDYTPLSSLIRGQSPPYALPVAETEANHTQSSVGDVPGRLEPGSKKSNNLSSETPKATKRASRRYQSERQEILSGNSSLSATQGGMPTTRKRSQNPGQSFTSAASSQSSKRKRRRASVAFFTDTSSAQSSQAADDYALSFSK